MKASGQDRLYNLLPSLYRQADEHQGQPLRALMAVLESEFRQLEEDVDAMYDDWFIETCDLWVVPYIADLLGVRLLQDMDRFPLQRRLVANSIAYRRRKGTIAVLEQTIHDATGWYAQCVEFAQRIACTQNVDHPKPDCGRTGDLRTLWGATEHANSMIPLSRTFDVDNSEQGEYSTDCIGISLYRQRSYPVQRSFAFPVDQKLGRFTFDPFGRDMPMFNEPEPVEHASQRVQPSNLPLRITRADFAADLKEYRAQYGQVRENKQPDESHFYGPDRSLYVELPGGHGVKPSTIVSMDLSQWPAPPILNHKSKTNLIVAVDVELGRIALLDQQYLPEQAEINVEYCTFHLQNWPSYLIASYNYGFSSEVGGGPYLREVQLPYPGEPNIQINVAKGACDTSKEPTSSSPGRGTAKSVCVPTLQDAIMYWQGKAREWQKMTLVVRENAAADWRDTMPFHGLIRILDNGVYQEDLEIGLPEGTGLSIVADTGMRPIIGISAKPVTIKMDQASIDQSWPQADCKLYLNGLLICGGLRIDSSETEGTRPQLFVSVEHCTLVNSENGALVPAPIQSGPAIPCLTFSIRRCILGPLYLPASTESLSVSDSIVDNKLGYAIAADPSGKNAGPAATLSGVTIFGPIHVEKVAASKVIFNDPLLIDGPAPAEYFQHCFVPQGSLLIKDGKKTPIHTMDIATLPYTSTCYGDPGYCQLSLNCPSQIRCTPNGSEIGVFHDLYQAQAEENLREILKEFLPVGLRAHIQYVT